MPKNIIIFSDGTGQEGGVGNNTNIYKLFNIIEDRTDRQIAFYDRGLGTGLYRLLGSLGGFGISRNIKDCYRFIFENFNAGDQIYLLGFSRGAATVRSLSSFIHYFGILPKSRPELIDQAYKIYKTNNEKKRNSLASTFIKKHHTMWARIRFLGCYDSVAALGLPWKGVSAILDYTPLFKHKFHNFRLSECVENAYQALAIDDQRKAFHPILWDINCANYQHIRQVWFCGMHTDVGGGYAEQGLSDIPLTWLTDMSVRNGLHIYAGDQAGICENINDTMHDSRGTKITRLIYTKQQRYWDKNRTDKPVVHESVLQRSLDQHNNSEKPYQTWILNDNHDIEPWIKYEQQTWNNKNK